MSSRIRTITTKEASRGGVREAQPAPGDDPETLYRRSPHLVSYWSGQHLVFHNFATNTRVGGSALTTGLLDYFDTWRPLQTLIERTSLPVQALRATLTKLVEWSMLQESRAGESPTERAMEQWASWNPAAGFFHFSTKDLPFDEGEAVADRFLSRRLATRPIPPITKKYRQSGVSLPDAPSSDRFARVLLERRTWRRFGRQPLPLSALGTLMKLTFGAQKFVDLGAAGTAMMRTSPS